MKKIIIFLFVGCSSALIDVGALYILSKLLLVSEGLSVSVAFTAGLIFNYLCHTYLTFNKSVTQSNIIKYLIVVLINYLLTLGLIKIQTQFNIDIVIAKIITLPIVAMVTFILSNKWVYK